MSLPRFLCLLMPLLLGQVVVASDYALSCSAEGALTPCLLPQDSDGNPTGQHICRKRFNVAYLEVVPTPLCISLDQGKEGDECGCCNGGCPVPCFEPCPLDQQTVGVYVYDWWSWRPRRLCASKGQSLKLKQGNAARWACVPPAGLFGFQSLFDFEEGEDVAAFNWFGVGW